MVSSFLTTAYIYLDAVQGCTTQTLARSSLVVIVHDVNLSTARTSVAGTLRIIHYAVAEVYVFCLHCVLPLVGRIILVAGVACPSVSCTIKTRTAVHEMTYEVVVEAG